jgi:hypothetical protein
VELDTRPGIKFQVLQGGLPNDFVFANDRRKLFARNYSALSPRFPASLRLCVKAPWILFLKLSELFAGPVSKENQI